MPGSGSEQVRVLARDPAKLGKLEGNVEVVKGDLASPETLDAAFAGADKAFVLATGPTMTELASNAFEAAKKAGVKHVVFVSSSSVVNEATTLIGQWHTETEKKLKASGLTWTILQPGAFASNTLWWARSIKEKGALFQPVGEGTGTPIDPRDIAEVAVMALTSPGHESKSYVLSGPEQLTMAEQLAKIGAAIGKELKLVDISEAAMREGMEKAGSPEVMIRAMLELTALTKSGHVSEVTPTVEQLLGRKPRSFDEWVQANVKAFT